MDVDDQPCPSPSLCPPSSSSFSSSSFSLLRDISNFKTPKRSFNTPNFQSPCPLFFTASKQTPRSSSTIRRSGRPSLAPSSARSKAAARRLKAFEVEQSQSSRKAQIKKDQSLKSLSKSLTVWLNFLFKNPISCGCDSSISGAKIGDVGNTSKGKRDSEPVGGVGVDGTWRNPKRQRDLWWRGDGGENAGEFSNSMYSVLRSSLKDVCSFDDLKQRMRVYLSLGSCKEIFDVMTQVTKNIDEGRLKMKSHCPILTDVGMKEKAMRIIMCYNPIWLRIGLYIIFGGDSLLSNGDVDSDQEITFLKMMIEKQFFKHAGLAKAFAYNKMVEGLYRPGYYETLGNIILKRILLLVLVLDRAKSQSSLPLKYGIDGVDGGSPLLFTVQSGIKSSRQVIHDFLSSDVMHGEGNLLAHLVIVGYKVSYQQCPLIEYDFGVTDLFVDLQDGVRLCRVIQLLQQDPSILTKMVVPSDTRKRNLANCGIALQYLRQAGVMLDDEDGMEIMADDIATGDKELTLSLLWNMFVHLQLPLLINKTIIVEEVSKIRGFDVDQLNSISSTSLEMLLSWIQAICEKYDFKINNFSSLVDGKAIWCLLDYYFRRELCCSYSSKDSQEERGEESIMSAADYTDAAHNFILSQKLTTLLGNFPEVLQISDILEHNGAASDRSVIILLAFLSSQLIDKKNMDQLNFHKLLGCNCQNQERRHSSIERCCLSSEAVVDQEGIDGHNSEDAARKFKAIQAWWRDMTERNYKVVIKPATSSLQYMSTSKHSIDIQRENAAKIIQSHFRRLIDRRNYLKRMNAVCLLQTLIRAWLIVKPKSALNKSAVIGVQQLLCERWKQSEKKGRYVKFIVDRHGFVKLKRSVLLIQRAARIWIYRRHQSGIVKSHVFIPDLVNATPVFQKCICGMTSMSGYTHRVAETEKASLLCQEKGPSDLEIEAAVRIQLAWKNFTACKTLCNQSLAATKIQSHFRGWLLRKRFLNQKRAIIKIQSVLRCLSCRKAFQQSISAIRSVEAAVSIQLAWKNFIACKSLCNQSLAATKIQSHFRGWLLRKWFLNQKRAIIKMQSVFRCLRCTKAFQQSKAAIRSAIIIQSNIRRWIAWRRAWRHKYLIIVIQRRCRGWLARRAYLLQREAIVKIQSAIRCLKCWKAFSCYKRAAIEIQRFVRGEISRSTLLGASCFHAANTCDCNLLISRGSCRSFELMIVLSSVLKLQRWWKGVLLLKLRMKSAIIIQSQIRGWIARRKASRERLCIVVIQSYWKGYLARKESRGQLLDLRLRVRKSATNVDDGMRIINRLLSALSELLSMKSISGILHTCATLDMATEHSQKCCEKLVAAGAIETLLKLIRSVSRSIPDQVVLKHVLSTLRNLARYPHLIEVLIDSHGSVEIIFWELLRNKEEGYFIASEVLKKMCSNQKGVEALRKLPALLKRLHGLVEELTRKANNEKRNAARREVMERRLQEAVELLKLTTNV